MTVKEMAPPGKLGGAFLSMNQRGKRDHFIRNEFLLRSWHYD